MNQKEGAHSGLTILPQGFNEIVAPLDKSQVGMSALEFKEGVISPKYP